MDAPPSHSAPKPPPPDPLLSHMGRAITPLLPADRAAISISLTYLIFGLIYIAASDWVLGAFLPPGKVTEYQTIKGCSFIVVTATLLFLMVRHFMKSKLKSQSKMQSRLEGIAEEYRRLFLNNPSAMLIYHAKTRQIYAANEASQLLYGFSRAELLTMTTLDLVVTEERPRIIAEIAYKPGMVQKIGPVQIRRRDGRIIFVEAIAHEVDFDGKDARIALVTDVTERLQTERSLAQHRSQLEQRVAERTAELSRTNARLVAEVQERQRIEEDLRAASAEAEAANAAKSTFLAKTSHEIRTPLTSILGYADLLLLDSHTDEDRAHFLDILRQNGQHLLAMIDDLLDLSRAEVGKARLTLGDHSPEEIARQAIAPMRPRAAEKLLVLDLRIEPGVPALIHTDAVRLRQVLLNLLGNAIKFTSEGTVIFSISAESTDAGPIVRFDVSDTGIGLDAQDIERIFEPFFQVEQGSTRRYDGFGLGLAISRQLARQLGGEISVQSGKGKGSTFSVTIPVGITEPAGDETPKSPPPVSASAAPPPLIASILIAEDNDNIRMLVSEYLKRAGASVFAVVNGEEAVREAKASITSTDTDQRSYDLIILDLHMPILDGASAMKQIREMGFGGLIIALTADYAETVAREATSLGWDAMAGKPIDRNTFIPLLVNLLEQKRQG